MRLDRETQMLIRQIARVRKKSASEVMREAIKESLQRQKPTPHELMKDLIGSIHGGDPKLSENTGRRFTEYVKEKKKQGRL